MPPCPPGPDVTRSALTPTSRFNSPPAPPTPRLANSQRALSRGTPLTRSVPPVLSVPAWTPAVRRSTPADLSPSALPSSEPALPAVLSRLAALPGPVTAMLPTFAAHPPARMTPPFPNQGPLTRSFPGASLAPVDDVPLAALVLRIPPALLLPPFCCAPFELPAPAVTPPPGVRLPPLLGSPALALIGSFTAASGCCSGEALAASAKAY